jgi:DNA processing protein
VLAGGVDVVYPPENETLYEAIKDRGPVISEMRLGEQP